MKLGFIVGRDHEIYDNKVLQKKTPKKYLVDCYDNGWKRNSLQVDVGIAMTIKEKYPGYKVDIILPREISLERLKKNDINFVVGYDYINAINKDPPIKKFNTEAGMKKLLDIYKNKESKLFPPYEHMNFIWNKKKYLTKLKRAGIPISPTIFLKKNVSVPKLLAQISSYKWKDFIIKPIGGTTSYGLGMFSLKKTISKPTLLVDYFVENSEKYNEFIVQPLIKGFKKYGEIKSYWINGEFSYAVNIIDRSEDDYRVEEIIDPKIISTCKEIGQRVVKAIPKLKMNGKSTLPVCTRIDLTCCIDNKPLKSMRYFVNEIEDGGIAGSYINFKNVKYPAVEILADSFVKKANQLVE